jgi:hypothetical protein
LDLIERNLRVLGSFFFSDGEAGQAPIPGLCGTGAIGTGRAVLEYALAGCESVQLHTAFQLPLDEYSARKGTRTQRLLHQLVFHPEDGMIAELWNLERRGLIHRRDDVLHFLDLPYARHQR